MISNTNGATAIFLRIPIFRIQIIYNLTDCGVYFLIGEDFLGRIDEQDVDVSFQGKHMLLTAPAFADTALEKVAFHCTLE